MANTYTQISIIYIQYKLAHKHGKNNILTNYDIVT